MRIQLNQSEIEAAIRSYISKEGFNLTGKDVDISFTNTRNPTATIAEVEISAQGASRTHRIERLEAVPAPAVEADSADEGEAEVDTTEKKSLFG